MILDRPDDHASPHPGDNLDTTGRSVLYGVLQHVGAEPSAHETITAEQERWGSIAQLAAEDETIPGAAQRDRWATLIRHSGLTAEPTDATIESEAFGALTAELRRAAANHHDLDTMLPRPVAARGSPMLTTSPPSCTTGSPAPPPAQRARAAPARHRG